MALRPQDIHKMTPEDEIMLGKIEEKLDAKLRGDYDGSGSITVNLTLITNEVGTKLNLKLRRALKERYESAGWNVIFEPGSNNFELMKLLESMDNVPTSKIAEGTHIIPAESVADGTMPTKMTRDSPDNPYFKRS